MKKYGTGASHIYNQVLKDITSGGFQPGQRLREVFLAQRYKVSRASIREMLRQLASHGYVTHEKNRGAIVPQLSVQDLEVIYNILIRCESYAAARLAKNPDEQVFRRMEICCAAMETEEAKKTYKLWAKNNDKFHQIIFRHCGSPILSELIQNTRLRILRFRMLDAGQEKALYNAQHKRILQSLRKGDSEKVEKLMVAHMETAKENRLRLFRNYSELFAVEGRKEIKSPWNTF